MADSEGGGGKQEEYTVAIGDGAVAIEQHAEGHPAPETPAALGGGNVAEDAGRKDENNSTGNGSGGGAGEGTAEAGAPRKRRFVGRRRKPGDAATTPTSNAVAPSSGGTVTSERGTCLSHNLFIEMCHSSRQSLQC